MTTVIWTVTDVNGRTATCNQTVTVVDTQNPTITCPVNVTNVPANAGQCYATGVALGTPTTADNCGVASVTNNAPVQFPVGTTTVIWTVTDVNGRTATCNQTVTVVDTQNPTITCPANVTNVPANAGQCYATGVALGTPTTADNCGVATVTNNAPVQFPVGVTTVIWTVTDVNGRTATCNQTVTVVDTQNPTITCPVNVTNVPADANQCYATGVALGTPTTADNCGVASVTNNAPAQFPVGATTVIWTVTDVNGRTATCNQTVTVVDTQNPTITCPVNVTNVPADANQCYATGVALGTPTTADNCGVATVTNNAPVQFPVGVTTVIWTVTDVNGRTATCNQTVTVVDTQNPTITCPVNVTNVPADANQCYATGVALGTPTTADNCGVATVTNNAPAQFPVGVTTVIWTVTDVNGRTATCNQTVTVVDTQNPTITCPVNVTNVPADANQCYATGVALGTPTTADNCGVASVTNNAPVQFPVGVTTVIWTVTDVNGRTATCNQTVTVVDTQNPTITCPVNVTNVPADANQCYATGVALGTPTTADNCGVASVTNNAPVQFPVGVTTVIWTVTDVNGRTATCNQTVTVVDTQNPTITCPANVTNVPANAGQCYATGVALGTPTTADNCGVATVTNNAPVQFPVGVTTVIWTVTDVNGRTATCNQTVTVVDTQNPTITCPVNVTNVPADANQCYATGVALGTPTTADNCGVASVTNNAPVQFAVGVTTVIWTVTDVNGRTATCNQTVTVVDTQNPTITCPVNVTNVPADANQCYATGVALGTPTTADNCGVATVTNNAPAQFPVGVTTVIWTVTDVNGRTATCNQTVTVVDTQNPTITCPVNVTNVPADANQCYATGVALGTPTTADNCGVATVTNNAPAQFPVGTTTVIWTVTDVNGRTATCSQTVTVVDTQDPTITCAVPAASYTADAGECYYTVTGTALDPTATDDNCGVLSVVNDFTGTSTLAGAQFSVGTTTVIWTITDIHGNDTQCQYDIIVTDDEDPTITCAVPTASYTADAGECYYTVTGTTLDPTATDDNCGVLSVVNDFTGTSTLAGAQFPVGTTTVIWTITDIHGNDATCQYDIIVTDDEDPTITCAVPAASYTADAGECYYTVTGTTLDPTATDDNCGVLSVVNDFTGTSTLAGAQFPVGTTTVIWTITDIHGNDTQCQYDIIVTDDEDPTITCAVPAASYTADAGECYYTVTGTALDPTATDDNCGVLSVVNDFTGTSTLAGAQFPVGTTTVIWTITDIHGNDTQCQYDIIVTDDEDPTITCAVPAASYTADAGECYYTVTGTALDPTATDDNCGVLSVVNDFTGTSTLAGAQFPVGTTTVIWTITDIHGNDTQCQYDIIVTDDEDPTITCTVPAASYTADAGECYYTVTGTALDPTATDDNCGVLSVVNDFNGTSSLAGAQFPVGTTTVIWTITDIHGNDTQCQYDIIVTDDEDPTITCAVPAASYTADAGECYYTVTGTALDPTATDDNCGVLSVVNDFTGTSTLAGAQFPVGTTTVIWTITDIHGNDTHVPV